MLYFNLIEKHLENNKSRFQDDLHCLTYKELNYYSRAFYEQIKNLPPNGTILICSDNNLESCICILGCIAIGYRYTVVHNNITDSKKEFILNNANIVMVVGTDSNWLSNCKYEGDFFNTKQIWKLNYMHGDSRSVKNQEQDVYILYTSGSTKSPKGVLAGISQVLFCINSINSVLKNSPSDIIWNCLPLAFDYGMYQLFLALSSESSFYISPQPMISMIPKILVEKKITGFPVVPSLLGMLIKSKLLSRVSITTLRYITSTGDLLPVTWIKKFEQLLPNTTVVPMYGITECKRVAIMPLDESNKKYCGSCGLPLPGIEVQIEKESPDDPFGELIVYGPNVMKGYWKDAESTGFGYDSQRQQFSFRTGDLFSQDNEGFLYFVERKSTFIKTNGYRISGKEIDDFLLSKIDHIDEIFTLGIPDEILGQRIITIISSKCSLKDINKCVSMLPIYMRPSEVILVDYELPKNSNGKIDKNQIMEIVVK